MEALTTKKYNSLGTIIGIRSHGSQQNRQRDKVNKYKVDRRLPLMGPDTVGCRQKKKAGDNAFAGFEY